MFTDYPAILNPWLRTGEKDPRSLDMALVIGSSYKERSAVKIGRADL